MGVGRRQRMHPEDYRTYVIDRNINYTNVCTAKCTFCAFRRDHEEKDSYTLSYEKIGRKSASWSPSTARKSSCRAA
jgi:cyclic dehypoxanthinyl futalosine synthase